MFDIGFIELVICGVIALLVLGPERLPEAARTAGRWVGGARRMVSQFSSELDRQLKAEELRKELRKAGDEIGLEEVEKSVRGALDEAKQYEDMILPEDRARKPRAAPATRRVAEKSGQQAAAGDGQEQPAVPEQEAADWQPPDIQYDPHAVVKQASHPDTQTPDDTGRAASDSREAPKDKPESHS
ncbi:sec-independent protein translocase protein TatB [Marinobacter daqiaonensis]|uniref:Sec-independent protein translocase protein TatB n=1 Tax=Marinobacter daqiaonensis TaxID=650891 RepID=A0A1I6HZS7_9GAMM|nr:Sec-independent protein translocase protein TatB [Marinobacter daqiaonensis]SFR59953.1 sec-independent protein translocase protein TatB [Marinobacter daqiaonensis]